MEADGSTPYVVLVMFKVEVAQTGAFAQAMLGSAASVRGLPDNRRYDINQDPADPTSFMLYEVFESEAAWERHHARPELQDLLRRIKPMLTEKPNRSVWTHAIPA